MCKAFPYHSPLTNIHGAKIVVLQKNSYINIAGVRRYGIRWGSIMEMNYRVPFLYSPPFYFVSSDNSSKLERKNFSDTLTT